MNVFGKIGIGVVVVCVAGAVSELVVSVMTKHEVDKGRKLRRQLANEMTIKEFREMAELRNTSSQKNSETA